MSHDWFYMQAIPEPGATADLDVAEARHALGSRRLDVTDTIILFDGAGTIARATIIEAAKRSTTVKVSARHTQPPSDTKLTLAAALPKGDRQSVMLSMAAQLGIARFIPLRCERAVAKPGKGFEARTQRIFIEACKQSRQAYVPGIESQTSPADAARSACERGEFVLLADPAGEPLVRVPVRHPVTLMVGPEGGFTDAERTSVQAHGAVVASLGAPILRTETASAALVAWTALMLQPSASSEP